MNTKTPSFFIKLKNAILNFDEYKEFAKEKVSKTIIYLVLLLTIFSVIIIGCLTFLFIDWLNKEDNQFTVGFSDVIGIIINNNINNIEEIQESNNYQMSIGILKNNVVLKSNGIGMQNYTEYSTLESGYIISIILFIMFLLEQIIIDVFLISIFGFLLSRILGLKLKYNSIFNISVYSLTLSILLYLLYIIVNLFTGFNIIYFYIAYRGIAYVYIVTALLIIKSDLIKQNIELTRIIDVQKQVREEHNREEENKEDKNENKEKQKNKKNENKKEENEEEEEPQGTEA